MDVEAIARRIAQDHGVTVLEKDVIETLEKLKAASKEKITGAGEAQVTAQKPEVSPITSASNTQKVTEQPPAPLQTGSAPLQTGAAPLSTSASASSAPLPADVPSLVAALQQVLASYKQPSGTVPAASEQPNESDST